MPATSLSLANSATCNDFKSPFFLQSLIGCTINVSHPLMPIQTIFVLGLAAVLGRGERWALVRSRLLPRTQPLFVAKTCPCIVKRSMSDRLLVFLEARRAGLL